MATDRQPIKGFYTVDAHEIRVGDDIEVSSTIWTEVLTVAEVERGVLVWGRGLRHPLAIEGFARVGRPLSEVPRSGSTDVGASSSVDPHGIPTEGEPS